MLLQRRSLAFVVSSGFYASQVRKWTVSSSAKIIEIL